MKLEPTRITLVAAIAVCIIGMVIYIFSTYNMSPVSNKEVSVSAETEYSSDKNAPHDLLIIFENGKYGLANHDGKVVIDPKYDMIISADYGLYYVKEGKTQGFLNQYMQPVFMTEETINTNFSEGFVIYTSDKKNGFINLKTGGKIEAVYEAAYDFSEGLAAVQKDNLVGFINTSGEMVIPPQYYPKGLYYFKSGLCSVRKSDPAETDSSSYYINQSGQTVIEDQYQYGMPFYENMAFVKKNDEWFVIDNTGKRISEHYFGPYEKTIPGRFKDGRATVIAHGKYGVIDKEGQYVIPPEYEELSDPVNDKIVFKQNGLYGYMTMDGKIIIEPQYAGLGYFKNGVSAFTSDNKFGLVAENGKEIYPPEYEKIEILDNGRIKVFKEGKAYFYSDVEGNVIWQPSSKQ